MFLDIEKHKLKFICFDTRPENKSTNIKDVIFLSNVGKGMPVIDKFDVRYRGNGLTSINRWDINKGLFDASIMYLGSNDQLKRYIEAHLYKGDVKDIKSLYLTKSSVYPRDKIRLQKDIKLTIKKEKATVMVISDHSFQTFTTHNGAYGKFLTFKEMSILHSPKEDTYYCIDGYPLNMNPAFQPVFEKYAPPKDYYSEYDIRRFAAFLINSKFLPEDTHTLYYGPVILNTTVKEANILRDYASIDMQVIYDTDLDTIICKDQESLTFENVNSISTMLSSTDKVTVELGLKILGAMNIKERRATVKILMLLHWKTIKDTKFVYSVGFKHFLNLMGLTIGDINRLTNYGMNESLADAYQKADNEEDKKIARQLAIAYINKTVNQQFDILVARMKALDLKVNISVE